MKKLGVKLVWSGGKYNCYTATDGTWFSAAASYENSGYKVSLRTAKKGFEVHVEDLDAAKAWAQAKADALLAELAKEAR